MLFASKDFLKTGFKHSPISLYTYNVKPHIEGCEFFPVSLLTQRQHEVYPRSRSSWCDIPQVKSAARPTAPGTLTLTQWARACPIKGNEDNNGQGRLY